MQRPLFNDVAVQPESVVVDSRDRHATLNHG